MRTLFDRRPTGVELTDMGRLLLRHAAALDAGARDLDREIRLAKGLELGELRIGVGPWGGAVLVAPAIGRLHAQHPRLRMRVVVAPWRELPARLRARDVDIVVGALGEIGAARRVRDLRPDGTRTGRGLPGRTSAERQRRRDAQRRLRLPARRPGAGRRRRRAAGGAAAGAAAGSPAAATGGGAAVTIECDSSDVLKRMLHHVRRRDVPAPLRRRRPNVRDGRLVVLGEVDLGRGAAPARRGCAAGRSAERGTRFLEPAAGARIAVRAPRRWVIARPGARAVERPTSPHHWCPAGERSRPVRSGSGADRVLPPAPA